MLCHLYKILSTNSYISCLKSDHTWSRGMGKLSQNCVLSSHRVAGIEILCSATVILGCRQGCLEGYIVLISLSTRYISWCLRSCTGDVGRMHFWCPLHWRFHEHSKEGRLFGSSSPESERDSHQWLTDAQTCRQRTILLHHIQTLQASWLVGGCLWGLWADCNIQGVPCS